MARVKGGVTAKKRHKAVKAKAKGYYGNRSRTFRSANEAVMHAGKYAYRDRRARKGQMRRLWIQRINAACRQNGTSYSRFIAGLKAAACSATGGFVTATRARCRASAVGRLRPCATTRSSATSTPSA